MTNEDQKAGRVLDLRNGLPAWFSGDGWLVRTGFGCVEKVLGYDQLDRLFTAAARDEGGDSYLARLSRQFGLRVVVDGEAEIPGSGPVVVVANHPFGGADAITIGEFVIGCRPDTRILANAFLASVEPLKPHLIGVDVYGEEGARKRNLQGMRLASRHLAGGGCLVVFPAGEVASWQWRSRRIEEAPWSSHLASLVLRHRATVVPLFVPGRNSLLFHFLGLVHPMLRTAWLGRELLRRRGDRITLICGTPSRAEREQGRDEWLREIRARVFALGRESAICRDQGDEDGTSEKVP